MLAPVQGPQRRVFHYNEILPNLGAVFDITPRMSLFANFSRGLQVPSTDLLYNSFFFPTTTAQAQPDPERTDNFDVGIRYRSSRIMAQLSAWYTVFNNRIAQAFDPDLDRTCPQPGHGRQSETTEAEHIGIHELQFYV